MLPTQSSDWKWGLVSVQGVSTMEWYLKLVAILYFADIELVRYIHTNIPVYMGMHVQCLGEERIFPFSY